jgi:hypothetical protein
VSPDFCPGAGTAPPARRRCPVTAPSTAATSPAVTLPATPPP